MITAKIIADSISTHGDRITTFELEYPRFVHSEFMTHRLFSRNAASSRAIPINKMIDTIEDNPAIPVHWGKNQPGMQANNELEGKELTEAKAIWYAALNNAIASARYMVDIGVHKQVANRMLEPFQNIKVVLTATEYDNFFYLRAHKDAQPEIKALAEAMWKEYDKSTPNQLRNGQWHLPYVDTLNGEYVLPVANDYENGYDVLTLEQAVAVSASCCAQVSYRLLDHSIEKAQKIYDQLVRSKPVHASPFEHQATPMVRVVDDEDLGWERGITHCDVNDVLWSGNFKGWIQHRQLIPENVCSNYTKE